jgi:hypothetical protein
MRSDSSGRAVRRDIHPHRSSSRGNRELCVSVPIPEGQSGNRPTSTPAAGAPGAGKAPGGNRSGDAARGCGKPQRGGCGPGAKPQILLMLAAIPMSQPNICIRVLRLVCRRYYYRIQPARQTVGHHRKSLLTYRIAPSQYWHRSRVLCAFSGIDASSGAVLHLIDSTVSLAGSDR